MKYVGEESQCMRICDFPNMLGLLCYIHTFSYDVPPSPISVAVSRMLSQDTALFRIQWNMKQLKARRYMFGKRFHVYMLSLCHKVSKQLTNSCQVFITVVYIMHCMHLLRFNFTWVNFQTTGGCLTKIVAALDDLYMYHYLSWSLNPLCLSTLTTSTIDICGPFPATGTVILTNETADLNLSHCLNFQSVEIVLVGTEPSCSGPTSSLGLQLLKKYHISHL